MLTLALAGVLVQYTIYLREIHEGEQVSLEESYTSSLAYFQELELD